MLRYSRGHKISTKTSQCSPHAGPWFNVSPPKLSIGLAPELLAYRTYMLPHVAKRRFVKCCTGLAHLTAKIDNPVVRPPPRNIQAIDPWPQHVCIRPTVRVQRHL